MKKLFKICSVIVAITIMLSAISLPVSAKDTNLSAGSKILSGLLNTVNNIIPDGKNIIDYEDFKSENFFEGNIGNTATSDNAQWNLGYAKSAVTPEDWDKKDYYLAGCWSIDNDKISIFKKIWSVITGKINFKLEEVLDDMYVRTIAINDGTGRGTSIIAVVDCIGISNKDVREIRSRIMDKLGDDYNISDITIAATHCHSCVDTQGIWTNTVKTIKNNLFKALFRLGNLTNGYDTDYMDFLFDKVSDSAIEACSNMKSGSLTYASKDCTHTGKDGYFCCKNSYTGNVEFYDINDGIKHYEGYESHLNDPKKENYYFESDENYILYRNYEYDENGNFNGYLYQEHYDEMHNCVTIIEQTNNYSYFQGYDYLGYILFHSKRPSSSCSFDISNMDLDMNRLVFTPSDGSTPTMIANVTAHPYSIGVEGEILSGDFVAYMSQTIENAGYNFFYFNGATAGIYTYNQYASDALLKDDNNRIEQVECFGELMGKMAISLSKAKEEIENDPQLCAEYIKGTVNETLLWYYIWEPVDEIELEPSLNTAFKEVKLEATNPVMQLAGKLNLTSNNILKSGKDYYTVTEVGLMQFGKGENSINIAMIPGELFPDLYSGGYMLYTNGGFKDSDGNSYPTLKEIFGDNTIVFGLANNAIGYIISDNDYVMNFDTEEHYHELLSMGKETASTLIKSFKELANDIK